MTGSPGMRVQDEERPDELVPRVYVKHAYINVFTFLFCNAANIQSFKLWKTKNPAPVCLSCVLISQFVIAHLAPALAFLSPTFLSALAFCVWHVQGDWLCSQEAASSEISNISNSNKGWQTEWGNDLFGLCGVMTTHQSHYSGDISCGVRGVEGGGVQSCRERMKMSGPCRAPQFKIRVEDAKGWGFWHFVFC